MIDLENTGVMRLDRGAMQNWSDLEHRGVNGARITEQVALDLIGDGDSVLVVAPPSEDFVCRVMRRASRVTVLTRSIPDGAKIAEIMASSESADVVCGDLQHLAQPLGRYDVVLAPRDLSFVPSLEEPATTWRSVFESLTALIEPQGRFLLMCENELGLQRRASDRSPYTRNDDSAWDVTSTFDASRPRTRSAVAERVEASDLIRLAAGRPKIAALLPTADEPTVAVWNEPVTSNFEVIANALLLGSPALERMGSDATRLARAAVLAHQSLELASGWLIVAGGSASALASRIDAVTQNDDVVRFTDEAGGIRTSNDRLLLIPAESEIVSEAILDACADSDLAQVRTLINQWWSYASAQAGEGTLDQAHSDLRFTNLVGCGRDLVPLMDGAGNRDLETAAWDALVDLVVLIRSRGARHPWPAATDDVTMSTWLGAMAGLSAPRDLSERLLARSEQARPAVADISGLLAVIERLEEQKDALQSRADWFETRLNARERQLRKAARSELLDAVVPARLQFARRGAGKLVRKGKSLIRRP